MTHALPTRSGARIPVLALAVGALAFGGCKASKAPVARLETTPTELRLAWPESREIEIAIVPTGDLPAGVDRPIVFVHLLDEPGSVVRTFDHELRGAWKPGKEIRYRQRIFQSALASPLPPGRYLLSIGLYDQALGRFALESRGVEVAKQEYQVATVEVPATSASGPEARFSGAWLAPEATADRQVVASRKLRGGGPGTIGFGPLAGPGTIHLGLVVPGASGTGTHLEVADGGVGPKVKVSSSCGGQQSEVSGSGRFELEVDVPATSPPASCELVVEPNFVVTLSDSRETVSVRLDELSFSAGTGGGS